MQRCQFKIGNSHPLVLLAMTNWQIPPLQYVIILNTKLTLKLRIPHLHPPVWKEYVVDPLCVLPVPLLLVAKVHPVVGVVHLVAVVVVGWGGVVSAVGRAAVGGTHRGGSTGQEGKEDEELVKEFGKFSWVYVKISNY